MLITLTNCGASSPTQTLPSTSGVPTVTNASTVNKVPSANPTEITREQALRLKKQKGRFSSSVQNATSSETNAKPIFSNQPLYPGDTVVAQQYDIGVTCDTQKWTANVPYTLPGGTSFPAGTHIWDDPTVTNWRPGLIVSNNVYVTIPTTGINYNANYYITSNYAESGKDGYGAPCETTNPAALTQTNYWILNVSPPPAPPSPIITKPTITVTQLSKPTIALTDAADQSSGALTWSVSGDVKTFGGLAFAASTTALPPHADSLSFTVPAGTAPGDYHLQIVVTSSSGIQSAPSIATVRVLPPAGYYSDVDPDGMFELDANGNVTQDDASTITETPGADTVPDFGVPSLGTTTSSLHRLHPSAIVVQGPFDPHNPTSGVITEISAFKAAKNVGCDFVVDYDNALHDPTRGVIAARGTYQIFAYCTPTLGYAFNYSEIGRNLNTGVTTGREGGLRACANTSDQYDGLFICTGTAPVPIAPTSGHAEYFSIIILYVGTQGITQNFPVQATYDQVPINNKGVVYPKINVASLNFQGPDPSEPGVVPFPNLAVTSVTPPGTFHSCPDMGSQAAAGCVARTPAANLLRTVLEKSYNPLPPNYSGSSSSYTPHHIQPVCWGGNNSAANGVFLLTTDPVNLHAQFTAWWQKTSFSPDGTSNPQPPSDDDC